MTPGENVAHHKAWAAYHAACIAELRASAVRARLLPFGAPSDRDAETARYEARAQERARWYEHHLDLARQYAALEDSGGDAREEAAAVPVDAPRRWPAAHELKAVHE